MGVGTNVYQTVVLFDGLSVHSFVCNYTIVCVLSICLSASSSIVCLCVRPCVCPFACMHIFVILFVTLSVLKFSFRSFVRLIVRPSCRLPSV